MRKRIESKYVKLAITLFLTGGALILFYGIVNNLNDVKEALSVVSTILSPFVFGLVMAYLLCPVYNFTVRKTYHLTCKKWKTKKRAFTFSRVIGTIIALVFLFGAIGGLFAMVLPELIKSIVGIVQVMPERLNDLIEWVRTNFAGVRHPETTKAIEVIISQINKNFTQWAQDEFLPSIGTYMAQISEGVMITLKTMLNLLIGTIICAYFLNSKELFKAQAKKMINATMKKEKSDTIFEFAYFTNKTFGGFVNGKIIDSIIMGILCFIVMTVINLPYTILVSTIVGVTNFIPFFGPFIGAVPSIIIICLVSPMQAVYFAIMILILQQIDGNIIGPKILGGTTGVASFWVMFAIIVGGGLFGFMGMVLGVPVFAVIYYYLRKFINKRLELKNMAVDTAEYEDFNKYDINRKDIL